MSGGILNEHDANQGAQSKGEFLGMSGNSGWYLLGSAGASVMMVIVLWGVFEVSLLFCLVVGVALCLLSVGYVFTLKNNRPVHYDTDFFESVLVEAGLLELSFGPRPQRIRNPFRNAGAEDVREPKARATKPAPVARVIEASRGNVISALATNAASGADTARESPVRRNAEVDVERKVPLSIHERVRGELEETQHQLEELLVEREGASCEWSR